MFKKAKFICSYAGCGKSYPMEKLHSYQMFKCTHRSILCPAQGSKYINNVILIYSVCKFINHRL